MNYTPEHKDNRMRLIYGSLIVCSLICMSLGTGLIKTILTSVSLVMLATGLFLFIRYDLTSYSYIVMERGAGYDFYINKVTGKRGAYVCYYPLNDAVLLEPYRRGTKKEFYQKYGKVFVYSYFHNKFCGDKYIIMFKNEGYYDAVICQLDKKSYDYLSLLIKEASKKSEEN